jgi:hypothetical protein
VQPSGLPEVLRLHLRWAQLACGGVAPVKEELTRAIRKIGDERHTSCIIGQHLAICEVDTILGEPIEQTPPEIVISNRADIAGSMSEAGDGVDRDCRIATWKWSDKGTTNVSEGRLTRDWSSESTMRSETDQIAKGKYDATADTDRQVVERVAELAEKHGVPRVHIALAWLLQKQPVTAPIIGATKISHLKDAVGALSVKLTPEGVTYLEEPYVPHPIVGHQ